MENALIVSCSEKSAAFFTEALNAASIKQVSVINSIGEARRTLLAKDYDLVIVDAPLQDETGESFSRHVASGCISQLILVVNSEHFNEVFSVCGENGALVISKPVSKEILFAALSLAKSARNKIKRMQAENAKLKQKIEDILIIDRAKCTLISYLSLNEQEAHRFIEKQAMDLRSTKRAISEEILKTYAN